MLCGRTNKHGGVVPLVLPEMTRPAFQAGTQVFFLIRLGKLYRISTPRSENAAADK